MDKLSAIKKVSDELIIRNFSERTIESYTLHLRYFLDYINEIPQKVNVAQIKEYILYLTTEKKFSSSTINSVYSAIQFYFEKCLGQPWSHGEIGRPKVHNRLPEILSQDEIQLLISKINNLKHKAMISLIYSSGIRLAEFLNLTIKDIDSKQMYVVVRQGKGKRDRTTLLSNACLDLLRTYYLKYHPVKYLFNGAGAESQYSETSIRKVLTKAVKNAGIKKRITIHTLRHSFATHLLENGTNLYYIKELLGHKSIKSTLIYLHLCSKDIKKIENPLDKLFENGLQ